MGKGKPRVFVASTFLPEVCSEFAEVFDLTFAAEASDASGPLNELTTLSEE